MSSPDRPRPDDPGFVPFAPPSEGRGAAGPETTPQHYGRGQAGVHGGPGQAGVPVAGPYGAQQPVAPYAAPPADPYTAPPAGPTPYGQPNYGQGGPYGPGGAPWEPQAGRRGLSGGKIAGIVVAALVAVVLLVVGGVALLGGLGGVADGFGEGPVSGGGSEPSGYGDDAALDELWDRCESGDGGACDDLFWDSPVNSEYEEFGNTCGGRFEHGPWSCAGEI